MLRLPLSKHTGAGATCVGHNQPLHSVAWSHDDRYLVTASADCTARVWAATGEPLFTIDRCRENAGRAMETAKGEPNAPHAAEVRQAAFYYLDKFVVLAAGPRLWLYHYFIDQDQGNDVAHKVNPHRYKAAHVVQEDCQAITAFSCPNAFMSNLIVAGCSDRSLAVHDLGAEKCVRRIPEAHTKPVSCVRLNAALASTSHANDAYELFLTSAADDTVKLWDLRKPGGCVRNFRSHVNKVHGLGCSFSPCLRYVATGSEDRHAYLYEVASGKVVERWRGGHTDAVTDVAFSPVHPQLATACLDGHVRFFSDGSAA